MRKKERRTKSYSKVWLFFSLEVIASLLITYIVMYQDEFAIDVIALFALLMISPLFRLKMKLDRVKDLKKSS